MSHTPKSQPFGTLLGHAPGDVPVYSSDYETALREEFPDRRAYQSHVDGVFMGYKWQCVEFARRWLYLNHGYVFEDVPMAYDIFTLRHVHRLEDDTLLPLRAFRNGSARAPEAGGMLIWEEGGEFAMTGHVAIITHVGQDHVCIAEQNLEHELWEEGASYSRKLPIAHRDGGWHMETSYSDVAIAGWVLQTEDDEHAEPEKIVDPRLMNLRLIEAPSKQIKTDWLEALREDEAAYMQAMNGAYLTHDARHALDVVGISETALEAVQRATNELHALFMMATRAVLGDERLLATFDIPPILWRKLHDSWDVRTNHMITGRFDFALSAHGLKVYEYNADSSSCYFECGSAQGKWASAHGVESGWDPGEELTSRLVRAWQAHDDGRIIHIMQDDDPEETYHALYMKQAMEQAGMRCKILVGLETLCWGEGGKVCDEDGEVITSVWKTWAWETALEKIRRECDEDEQRQLISAGGMQQARAERPRLIDVLLRPEVRVFEPFWTIIPSNKAILPVLWEMFPGHPYLLESTLTLTDTLRASGYVSKPIGGRCGLNITVVDHEDTTLEDRAGKFAHQDQIYQQLATLPCLDGLHIQLCTFTVEGNWAGACVRVDESVVIDQESDVLPLRVCEDSEWS